MDFIDKSLDFNGASLSIANCLRKRYNLLDSRSECPARKVLTALVRAFTLVINLVITNWTLANHKPTILLFRKHTMRDNSMLVDKLLAMCRDTHKQPLPSGVTVDNIVQIKMNSYTNTAMDNVGLNLYFAGVKEIPNRKYYSIDNLTLAQFTQLYTAIFDVLSMRNNELFGSGDKKPW